MSSSIPREFTKEAVAAASGPRAFYPYKPLLTSGEPIASLTRNNPWTAVATTKLVWGQGHYYDTTVARKHPYWTDKNLPKPTKDINQLRRDLYEWGFCMISEGTSPEQTAALRKRCDEQAQAERALGIAQVNAAQQHLWGLANKGTIYLNILDFNPEAVQAGALIEQMAEEFVGRDWTHYSLVSNISYPGCFPQGLHQDQTFIQPFTTPSPALINVM